VEAGLLQPCDTFPPASVSFVKPVTPILVDPATCRKVWNDLHAQAFGPAGPASAIEARSMLEAVMAGSHVFGFVGMTAESTFICFRGTHFLSEWLEDAEIKPVPYRFRSGNDAGDAHMGFQAIYETIRESVLTAVGTSDARPITIIGHSL